MNPLLERRLFLRMAAALGLGCAVWPRPRGAWAAAGDLASPSAAAPFLVSIQAPGAFDTTLFCDPKGITAANAARPPNRYQAADIRQFGPMICAPQVPAVVDFFTQYSGVMRIINGIDTRTLDHASGALASMTGSPDPGSVNSAAMTAAILGGGMSAAFVSNGGDDFTDSLVGRTGLGGGLQQVLDTPPSGGPIHRDADWAAVAQAMRARDARKQQAAVSRIRAQQLALFQSAAAGSAALGVLIDTVKQLQDPRQLPLASPVAGALKVDDPGLARAIAVAIAGLKHGQTCAVQLAVGGWDSHSDNDRQQEENFPRLTGAVDYLVRAATLAGVSDRLLIYIASDFARAPFYNQENGKDHWPITSVAFLSPGARPFVPVGEVVGATTDGQMAVPVDPKTLRPAGEEGVVVQPGHVHDAIRRLMGVADHPISKNYGLHMTEQLPLLG